jgi:hypothetical protein
MIRNLSIDPEQVLKRIGFSCRYRIGKEKLVSIISPFDSLYEKEEAVCILPTLVIQKPNRKVLKNRQMRIFEIRTITVILALCVTPLSSTFIIGV